MKEQIIEPVQEVSKITGMLRQHGINPTAQRLEIARILLSKPQHLSAEQVLNAVNMKNASVSKATVYNTLNLFAEKGLLRQMTIDPDRIYYDSNTDAHYHFYNEDTGELRDLDPRQLEIARTPELPENTVNSGIEVVIRLRNKDSYKS